MTTLSNIKGKVLINYIEKILLEDTTYRSKGIHNGNRLLRKK